jgi:hypothetical protein
MPARAGDASAPTDGAPACDIATPNRSRPADDTKDYALKVLLLVLVGCLLALTAGLTALMFRRDEPMLGLAGLTAAMGAAIVAVPYSALQDF